jgi:hypothetical protein
MQLLWKRLKDAVLQGNTKISQGTVDIESTATLKLAGTAVTASAAELNIMDGVTATAAELNAVADASARIVTTTATTLNLTVTEHGDRVILINTNSTVANTFTLPLATGTGAKFTLINNIAQTQGSIVVAANGTTQTLKGMALMANSSTTVNAIFALSSATTDKITLNRTTTGGAGPGDIIEIWDTGTSVMTCRVMASTVGNAATPFSET